MTMLQQYKHILVAIDGSYEAELAFRKAVEVALRNNRKLQEQVSQSLRTIPEQAVIK